MLLLLVSADDDYHKPKSLGKIKITEKIGNGKIV
jgi:hypothetical protein